MPVIEEHGGECCGIRHIYSFDNASADELDELIRQVDRLRGVHRYGDNAQNRMIEVVLSQRQMDGDRAPEGGWLPHLARHGFKLVNRFRNANSGRQCYVFHRNGVDVELPVEHRLWTGAVEAAAATIAPAVERTLFAVGDRIRYSVTGPVQSRRGQSGIIRQEADIRGRWYVDWDDGQCRTLYYGEANFARIAAPAPAPLPVAPTRILTRYRNVFADGRRGGEYETIDACRAAAPRCRRIDKVEYFSDGHNEVTENVQQ